MKALILENHPTVPDMLNDFVNEHTALFDEVRKLTNLQHVPLEKIHQNMQECQAIVFHSTFHNRRQLENILKMISTRLSHLTFRFYAWDFIPLANELAAYEHDSGMEEEFRFDDFQKLFDTVVNFVQKGSVYNIQSLKDYLDDKDVKDTAGKTIISKVTYDKKLRVFMNLP